MLVSAIHTDVFLKGIFFLLSVLNIISTSNFYIGYFGFISEKKKGLC